FGLASDKSRAARLGASPRTSCRSASVPERVAGHDRPGGDADPSPCFVGHPKVEPWNALDNREPGANCPLRLVLISFRIAEIGDDGIATKLVHRAATARDDIGAAGTVRGDRLGELFGI